MVHTWASLPLCITFGGTLVVHVELFGRTCLNCLAVPGINTTLGLPVAGTFSQDSRMRCVPVVFRRCLWATFSRIFACGTLVCTAVVVASLPRVHVHGPPSPSGPHLIFTACAFPGTSSLHLHLTNTFTLRTSAWSALCHCLFISFRCRGTLRFSTHFRYCSRWPLR